MKLKNVHVTTFRSILDSGPVDIEATTCLVGKNEAGKTAFLKALEGLKPVDQAFSYDRTRDYPRRDLLRYDKLHEEHDATIISTIWELDDADKEVLSDEFGEKAITGNEIKLERGYGNRETQWTVPVDENAVLRCLYERFGLKCPATPLVKARDIAGGDFGGSGSRA